MRGFVPTPSPIVDLMVDKLFEGRPPRRGSRLLDPGCGPGAFIDGVLRRCSHNHLEVPQIVGVELDPERAAAAAARFRGVPNVSIVREDFLRPTDRRFDYVIGNPPYVSITSLGEAEKAAFRKEFLTARGRFDLYLLFFEQALRLLAPGGRLVFITPEKFLYVKTAEPLRRLFAQLDVRELLLLDEATFGPLVTYPVVTTIDQRPRSGPARATLRGGTTRAVDFPENGTSLLPLLNGHSSAGDGGLTLADICLRVSCGVATGADGVFVRERRSLPPELQPYAHHTIAGRQLVPGQERIRPTQSMLVPYDREGGLLALGRLGGLAEYLLQPAVQRRLKARTCATRKPWHAFHDSVPLPEILRPKILCKDITATPEFWIDREGALVPRHSVYYLVPKDPGKLDALVEYLNSEEAHGWLRANCQRAANNYLRLQSAVLKRLPIPAWLAAATGRGTARVPIQRRIPSEPVLLLRPRSSAEPALPQGRGAAGKGGLVAPGTAG